MSFVYTKRRKFLDKFTSFSIYLFSSSVAGRPSIVHSAFLLEICPFAFSCWADGLVCSKKPPIRFHFLRLAHEADILPVHPADDKQGDSGDIERLRSRIGTVA